MMSKYLLLVLAAIAQLTSGRYYKPRPLQCPVRQIVKYEDHTVYATQIKTVTAPLQVNQLELNTVTKTSLINVTNYVPKTVTAAAQQIEVTEIQVVHTAIPVVVTQVSTITRTLVDTQVNFITSTATNYVTDIVTITSTFTIFQTATDAGTQFLQQTQTVEVPSFATFTQTVNQIQTSIVVETVPGNTFLGTTTITSVIQPTNTHSFTKMITQTVCPPSY